MAKGQRDMAKESFWREVFRRFAAGEASVREFCRHEQLTESAFYAWRRTIAERDGKFAPTTKGRSSFQTPAFVPAVVKAESRSEASVAIELAGGCVLRFSGPTAIDELADLIMALQSRCGR